jgi:hypothetical protein
MITRPWRIPDEALVDLGTHHYIIIPYELLDGAPSAISDEVHQWPLHREDGRPLIGVRYCIVEWVPGGTYMVWTEEYAPPGGIWDVMDMEIFASIADARAWLTEHGIAEPNEFGGNERIRDEHMPAELQFHRRWRRHHAK